jgi:hypothetical protein
MILEGIVTTLGPDGTLNVAPMGPVVPEDGIFDSFVLRPFRSAQTYHNLTACPEGVLHVTDDVLLLARAAIGALEVEPATIPAEAVRGRILTDCCRFFEFRISSRDDSAERCRLEALVPRAEIDAAFCQLAVLVEKTGGRREREAFALLQKFVATAEPAP